MTRLIVVYGGSAALLFAAGTPTFSEPTSSRSVSNTPTPPVTPDKTELADGQLSIPEEDAGIPAQQRKLEEVEDSQYLNATVYRANGEEIGKVQQVLKGTKTGKIEYTVFVSRESKL